MSAPTSPPLSRRQKNRQIDCKVLMLDDTILSVHIPVKSSGQVLYDEVIRKLQLLEADYFDLEYEDVRHARSWLDHDKPVLRQLPRHNLDLRFVVKFYTPDPGQLEEDYTRYLFALQVRRDLLSGTLPCQEHTAVLLASYVVQAELGDFSDEFEVPGYLKDIRLLPKQTEELEQRIAEHHRDHTGQTPAVAEFNLLDTARKVDLYGIQTHPAKDHEGVPLHLAVAHLGVLVFQNQTKINTFSWAKIRKLSFKRKKFLVKLHPEGYGYYKDIVEFYFESRNDCKNFWKKCLEHHAFFRCHSVKRLPRNKTRLVSRGSSFRYCGRTQKQLAEYVRENCNRRPEFQRSTSMRTISLSHSVATTPKTGTLKSRAEHHLSHPNIRSSGSSHAICLERAHARERYKHAGRSDTAPSRSLQTFREPTRQALTPPGGTKKGGDELSKVRKAKMELRNGTLDDFNLSYFKSGYSSDKQSRDAAYHDNMSQDSYQLTESHDSLDFDRVEPGAVDGNELCRQLGETMEGERTELENQEDGTVRTAEESENATFVESGDVATKLVKDGETVGDLGSTGKIGEIVSGDNGKTVGVDGKTVGEDGKTVGEDGVEDEEELSVSEAVDISLLRRKRLSRGDAVGIRDDETASPSHEVTSSPGREVTSSPDDKVTSSPGREVTSSPGHQVSSSLSDEVTGSPGHEVTISPVHSGVDAKDGDASEQTIDSSENVLDAKSFQRSCKTPDVQENPSTSQEISSSPGHKVTSSPGHKATSSPGHKVTSSPGHKVTSSPSHNSGDNLDKKAELETVTEGVSCLSEADRRGHLEVIGSPGQEVIRSPGQEVTRSLGQEVTGAPLGQTTSLEKSEVSVEQKTAMACSLNLADTLLPSEAGFSVEPPDERSTLEISQPTIPGQEEKPKSSMDLNVPGNGQDETRDCKVENEGNNEDAAPVVPLTGENLITSVDTEFPYILHKRHLASKGEQTDITAVPNASLSVRRFRSRSPSPGNKKLTREEQRAELEKVKATLSSLAFPRKDPSVEKRRILDFVVYSRLPPRDSFSSKDDSISPTTLERALVSKGSKGSKGKEDGGSKRLTNEKPRIGSGMEERVPPVADEGDSIREISEIKDKAVESEVVSLNKRTLGQSSLDGSRTQRRYSNNDGAVGGGSTDLGAGELVLDAYLDVEMSSSVERFPDEFGSGLYIGEDSDYRTSFPPNVVGASMCSLEEFMMDVDLPAPIVESEEFDTSTSNSGGEVSVLEQSGRDEDVASLEKEALEERLAQVVLPPPPPPPLEGVWSDDDALNMELLEPPSEMLELFVDDDDGAGIVGENCDSVDLFDEVSSENLKRFGAEGGVVGGRFTVEDLAVFNALHSTTDSFRVTSSPIPSPPPPPFPWCDDDAENSIDPGLSPPSEPMVDVEKGPLETFSGDECKPESDISVHKIIGIESSPVVSTSTSGDPPAGKDPLDLVENATDIDSTMLVLSTTKLHQPPNLVSNEERASSSLERLEDVEQLCNSTLTIPRLLCSLEPGLSSETTHELLDVAAGHDFLSPGTFSDQSVHGDISDEDDVEKPYTEHSLHDLFRNLEAEAHAKPFHVPISADIPITIFHSVENVSLSRVPDSSDEIPTVSLCITEHLPSSIVEPLFGESCVDDEILDQESLQYPSQTVSLQSMGSSSNSQCSSTKP